MQGQGLGPGLFCIPMPKKLSLLFSLFFILAVMGVEMLSLFVCAVCVWGVKQGGSEM